LANRGPGGPRPNWLLTLKIGQGKGVGEKIFDP